MLIDVRQYEEFPAHVSLAAAEGEVMPEFDEVVAVHSVTAEVTLHKSGEEYFCKAEFASGVTLECARCLRHFDATLSNTSDFIICQKGQHDEENAVDSEDYVYFGKDGHTADVRSIARQSIVLAIDMSPLCREDCKGLCPNCKANLNDGPCDCEEDAE